MKSNKDFTDFLISEYQNIANAHFENIKQVTIFFRYYLLLISAPSIILIWSSQDSNFITFILAGSFNVYQGITGIFFIIIGLIGSAFFVYIINLKFDAILYAKTVNGIRNYFYTQAKLKKRTEAKIRVLPLSKGLPKYNERWTSFPAYSCDFGH